MRTFVSILCLVLAVLCWTDPAAAQRRPRAHRRGATAPGGTPQRRNLGGKGSSSTAFDTYNTEHTTASTQETESVSEQEAVIASSSGVEGGQGGTTKSTTPWFIAAGVLLGLLAVGVAYWAVAKNRRKNEEEANKVEVERSKGFRLMGAGAAAVAAVAPVAAAKKSEPAKEPAPAKKSSVKKSDTSGRTLPLIGGSKKEQGPPAPAKKPWFKFGKK
jgi:hypothetical protein